MRRPLEKRSPARPVADVRRNVPAANPSDGVTPASSTSRVTPNVHVYGLEPVLEVLRAGKRPVEHVILAEGANDHRLREVYDLARMAHIPVRRVQRNSLIKLIGDTAKHQGVVARVGAARYADSGELLSSLGSRVGTGDPPLAVVLDGIEDPHNLGAVVRTVECVGAHGVFIPERRAAGLGETVAKVAAGALEHVPVARVTNLTRLIEALKELSIWTIGASADAQIEYTAWDFSLPTVLFLGSEGSGLHRLVRERCDALVRIPLRGRIGSLNVSVTAGVILYEALRQRNAAKQS